MAKKEKPTLNGETLTSHGKFMVEIELDDKELAAKARKTSGLDKDLALLREDFAKARKEWTTKINAKDKERLAISAVVDAGREKRQITCMEERDYAGNEIRYRDHAGKLIWSRQMSTDEMQLRMEMRARQPLNEKKKFPGDGSDSSKFKDSRSAAANDKEDLTAVIHEETKKGTKRSSVDGPTR